MSHPLFDLSGRVALVSGAAYLVINSRRLIAVH